MDKFGEKQKNIYTTMLKDKMKEVAINPKTAGKKRDDIKLGYYSAQTGRHTQFSECYSAEK